MSKNIIITGASSGLGNEICTCFKELGFNVVGLSRNKPVKPLFDFLECDVGDYIQVKKTFKKIKKEIFEPHVLINAAGIASMNLFLTTPPSKMEQIMRTNVLGTMFCCQEALKLFARQKNARNTIINFSTIAVNIALKGESVYVASKGAVESFSRTLSKEAADFNCTVNTIAPGPVDTNLTKGLTEQQINNIVSHQAIQEKASKKDIFNVCKLLISEEAKDITGQIFNIKGV